MNWYQREKLEDFCKQAGIWDRIKGVGKGLMDAGGGVMGVIKNLFAAGISAAEIVEGLISVFGEAAKIPGEAKDYLQEKFPPQGQMEVNEEGQSQIESLPGF
jgi:hypothetical protein